MAGGLPSFGGLVCDVTVAAITPAARERGQQFPFDDLTLQYPITGRAMLHRRIEPFRAYVAQWQDHLSLLDGLVAGDPIWEEGKEEGGASRSM
jgi:hypothetical protein